MAVKVHNTFCSTIQLNYRKKLAGISFKTINNWASLWDYGTYHIGDQRRLRRACAFAQSRQSLRCSHTWSMEVDEGSEQISDMSGCLRKRVWRMSLRRTKSAIISRGGLIKKSMCFFLSSRLLQSEPGCEEGMDTLLLSGVDDRQREILDRNPEAIFGRLLPLVSFGLKMFVWGNVSEKNSFFFFFILKSYNLSQLRL